MQDKFLKTDVRVASIKPIIKNELKLCPYKMTKRQYLTPVQKENWLDSEKILLRDLKADTRKSTKREIVFSDEKLFTIKNSVKNQNDWVYAKFLAVID